MSVYERNTLTNGIRVVTAPMAHAQSTACFVMLAAGSRYEAAEENGLAHFVEHMLFTGTERRPSVRALTGEVDAIGGQFNAATSKEYTYYYVKCASAYAPQALDVLADMLRNSRFDLGEVEREKGVIVEEMRSRFDTPRDYVDELYEQMLYGETPLGRRTLGRFDTVEAVTRDACVDYVTRLYEPTRMVVGLAGRVEDALLEAVEQLLGDLEPRPAEGPDRLRSTNGVERVRIDGKDSDQANLCLGFRSYPLSHPDRYVLQLLATILGGGMSSRLTEELTMRRGLAYTIRALNHSHTDAGSLWAQGGVNVERVDDAVEAIAAELLRVAGEPVPQGELDKARNYSKGRFVFSIETPQGLLSFGLRRETLEARVAQPDEVIAGLDAVTVADVQRVANDLTAGGLYLALVGPYDDPARFEHLIG
ncbi:MAG: M16 family metallopeptidase [Gaiellaceae bacterium]